MPALVDLHQDHKTVAEEGLRAFKRTTVLAYEIPWNNLNFSHQAYMRLEERRCQKRSTPLPATGRSSTATTSARTTSATSLTGPSTWAATMPRSSRSTAGSSEPPCGAAAPQGPPHGDRLPGRLHAIRMLKANDEREIEIFGVDARADAIGRFLCDGFATVPPGASPEYIPALLDVVARERPNVLFVQSSYEVGYIARRRAAFEELGARVLVAAPDAIDLCNDKAAMHAALSGLPVPQPRLLLPAGLEAFVAGAHDSATPTYRCASSRL